MYLQLLLSRVSRLQQSVRRQMASPVFPLIKNPISPQTVTPKISWEMMYEVSVLVSTVPNLSGEGQEAIGNKTLVTLSRVL